MYVREMVLQAFTVMGIGFAMVFAVLAIFYGLVKALMFVFPARRDDE